jgi:hypothetical protein
MGLPDLRDPTEAEVHRPPKRARGEDEPRRERSLFTAGWLRHPRFRRREALHSTFGRTRSGGWCGFAFQRRRTPVTVFEPSVFERLSIALLLRSLVSRACACLVFTRLAFDSILLLMQTLELDPLHLVDG